MNEFLTGHFGTKDRRLSESELARLHVDFDKEDFYDWYFSKTEKTTRIPIWHFTGSDRKLNDYSPFRGWFPRRFPRTLLSAFVASEARLLIWQVSKENEGVVSDWARWIVGQRGPAVVVVSGEEPLSIDEYFTDLYAGIIHNQPLRRAAQPKDSDRLSVFLFLGRQADDLLRFDRWTDQLFARVGRLSEAYASTRSKISRARSTELESWQQYLHRADIPRLSVHLEKADAKAAELDANIQGLRREIDFSRESGGVYPLTEIAARLPTLETAAEALYPRVQNQLREDARKAAERAPRVLNANFADPKTRQVSANRQGWSLGANIIYCWTWDPDGA